MSGYRCTQDRGMHDVQPPKAPSPWAHGLERANTANYIGELA